MSVDYALTGAALLYEDLPLYRLGDEVWTYSTNRYEVTNAGIARANFHSFSYEERPLLDVRSIEPTFKLFPSVVKYETTLDHVKSEDCSIVVFKPSRFVTDKPRPVINQLPIKDVMTFEDERLLKNNYITKVNTVHGMGRYRTLVNDKLDFYPGIGLLPYLENPDSRRTVFKVIPKNTIARITCKRLNKDTAVVNGDMVLTVLDKALGTIILHRFVQHNEVVVIGDQSTDKELIAILTDHDPITGHQLDSFERLRVVKLS